MTQVKEWSNPELNRALAELMGYTVHQYEHCKGYVLITPNRRLGNDLRLEENLAWADAPDYCNDSTVVENIQAVAIAKDKNFFLNNLAGVVAGYFPQSFNWEIEWENDVIIMLISATPRERAEAAYLTLKGQ